MSDIPQITVVLAPPSEEEDSYGDMRPFTGSQPDYEYYKSSTAASAEAGSLHGLSSPLSMGNGTLKHPGAGDLFLNTTGFEWATDFGSPLSSASGESVFSEGSDYSSSAPPSNPASPLLCPSPSSAISPLYDSFNQFTLNDVQSPDPQSYNPQSSRPRSASFSAPSNSMFDTSNVDGRPRSASASYSLLPKLDTLSLDASSGFGNPSPVSDYANFDNGYTDSTLFSFETSPQQPFTLPFGGQDLSPTSGQPSFIQQSMPLSTHHRRSTSLGGEPVSSDFLPMPPQDPSPTQTGHVHGDYLTVPNSLSRRNAHRRNQTHTGINHQGIGRGRSLGPSPRQFSRRSSPATSHLNTDFTYMQPSSPNSPSSSASSSYSTSPVSPASSFYSTLDMSQFAGPTPIHINVISPDDPGLSRRHTVSSSNFDDSERATSLSRHISDPYPTRRIRRSPYMTTQPLPGGSMIEFDSKFPVGDPAPSSSSSVMSMDDMTSGIEFPPTGEVVKETVASTKTLQASTMRRKHEARFECNHCGQKFTAKHNLNHHVDSHIGKKRFYCQHCGQNFGTPGVQLRHEKNSCKKNPHRHTKGKGK